VAQRSAPVDAAARAGGLPPRPPRAADGARGGRLAGGAAAGRAPRRLSVRRAPSPRRPWRLLPSRWRAPRPRRAPRRRLSRHQEQDAGGVRLATDGDGGRPHGRRRQRRRRRPRGTTAAPVAATMAVGTSPSGKPRRRLVAGGEGADAPPRRRRRRRPTGRGRRRRRWHACRCWGACQRRRSGWLRWSKRQAAQCTALLDPPRARFSLSFLVNAPLRFVPDSLKLRTARFEHAHRRFSELSHIDHAIK